MLTKKRVLLVEAPYIDLYGESPAVSRYFPLGLGYLASFLRSVGHEAKIMVQIDELDFIGAVLNSVLQFKPDIIGISAMTPNYPEAVAIAKRIKERFSIPVVLGGQHGSIYKDRILREQQEFDCVVYGEGEYTLAEMVNHLGGSGPPLHDIKGLAYRKDGKICVSPPRPLETKLDNLPFPARDLVDIGKFSTHSHIGGGKSATMLTSRGCPYQCSFCSAHNVDGREYREHSVEYVISEMSEIKQKYGIDYIFFQDDVFTLKRKRVEEICNIKIARKLDMTFGCFSRVDVMDEKLAKLLKDAGCRNVIFGIESGDEDILKEIKKKISLTKAKTAIEACNKVGLKSTASFVLGFPQDTPETIKKTIDFAIELKPTLAIFNPFVPFPGSEIFDEALHCPKTIDGWKKFLTVNVPPFSFIKGLSPEDIYKIAQKANKRFFFRLSQILCMIKTIRSLTDLKEYAKGAVYLLFNKY